MGGIMGCMDTDSTALPEPPKGYKYMACRHCDGEMLVGITRRKSPSHPECGAQKVMDNARQIAAKEGPYYDRWLAAQVRTIERLTRGGPPPVAGG